MAGWLSDDRLDPDRLLAEVGATACGGQVLFLGTVRNSSEDGDILGIEYTAYREMASAEFDRIAADAREHWPMAHIALRHRLGYIPVGEASIAIAVACPHRTEAYEASRYLIEETKKRVPIWKKERYASGASRWVEAAHA